MEKSPDLISSSSVSFVNNRQRNGKRRSKSFSRKYGQIDTNRNNSTTEEICFGDATNLADLTPGSLEVWLDLPDEIKFDPALAPFKNLYEQNHGKLVQEDNDNGDISDYAKNEELSSRSQNTDLNLITKINGSNRFIQSANGDCTSKEKSSKRKKVEKALRVFKLAALVACWVGLTVALLMNREKTDVALHTAVLGGEVKEYQLESAQGNVKVKVNVRLTGPFAERIGNTSSSKELYLWLHRRYYDDGREMKQNSSSWVINLRPDDELDFAPSATDSKTLVLEEVLDRERLRKSQGRNESQVYLQMHTTLNSTVPLTLTYQMHPIDERDGIIYATLLLGLLYILIIFEIINRTIAALLSSSLGVGILALCGMRPTLPELVSWLDVETLLLLFSMMLLVAILADTGLFDFLAVKAFEVTGGRIWPLINCLCLFTAIFSTFLDNVTTVLLMTPVTIRLCEVMELNPVPVLMSMVIFSNVGGAATPVGDPPNVIIASHPSILNANINFTTFTLHMGIGILLVSVQTYLQLRYMFRDISKLRHSVPGFIQEMRQELAVWRRAAASLSSYSRDEDIVRRALEKKVERLNVVLSKKEAGKGGYKSEATFCTTLAEMKIKYHIRDKQLLVKCIICVSFVVVVFFLHAIPELQRLSLGWTALLGALLLLVLSEREDLEPILARVEWSTLLFFAALFVLMEALSKLGLISWIGKITESLIRMVDEKSQLAVAIMLILWVSGLASAFVDNIPLATMMVRVTAALAAPSGLGLPLAPLAWALSFGACLGGNGTLIGASANVVCAGVAEQHGYRFTFLQYLKIGFPIMIGNLIVASVYLLFCHCVLEWH